MAINTYDVQESERRELAYAEYVAAAEFPRLCELACNQNAQGDSESQLHGRCGLC